MLYCPFTTVGECVSIDIIFVLVLAIMVKIMMIALMENTKAEKYLHAFSEFFFAPNPLRSDNEDKEEDDQRDN